MATKDKESKCGLVALVGRPNVGKSTLLNRLVGQKVSIVTPRPQTTRHRVTGILTDPRGQVVFIDTPGLHDGGKRGINHYMNRAATTAFSDADLVVAVVEAPRLTDEDDTVLARAARTGRPAAVVINMIDKIGDRNALLPYIARIAERGSYEFIMPVSAATGEACDSLLEALFARLPAGPHLFPDDQVTDRSERFLAAEAIREKLMTRLRDEVPYGVTVEIESFEASEKMTSIGAVVWVERDSHKGIVIGRGGTMLRIVGTGARQDLERMLGVKVHLRLWVKVREGWVDDERALHRFGYD